MIWDQIQTKESAFAILQFNPKVDWPSPISKISVSFKSKQTSGEQSCFSRVKTVLWYSMLVMFKLL